MLALRLFGRVAGYRLGRWLRLVCRLVLGRWAFASRLLVSCVVLSVRLVLFFS